MLKNTALGFWVDFLVFHVQLLLTFLQELLYLVLRNRPRQHLANRQILITGTGQGVGNLLLRKLARDNNTLHCVDINAELNEKVKQVTIDPFTVRFSIYFSLSP